MVNTLRTKGIPRIQHQPPASGIAFAYPQTGFILIRLTWGTKWSSVGFQLSWCFTSFASGNGFNIAIFQFRSNYSLHFPLASRWRSQHIFGEFAQLCGANTAHWKPASPSSVHESSILVRFAINIFNVLASMPRRIEPINHSARSRGNGGDYRWCGAPLFISRLEDRSPKSNAPFWRLGDVITQPCYSDMAALYAYAEVWRDT